MNEFSWVVLVLWGAAVGVDLASFLQIMISRPIVAGTVAGAILGDVSAGFLIGAVMELFALDLLAVGATNYPDYGLGTVAAVAAGAGAPGILALGPAIAVGLLISIIGGEGIQTVREANGKDVERHASELDRGDVGVVPGIQARALARDLVRGAIVTGVGLVVALVVRRWYLMEVGPAVLASLVAVGVALGTAGSSAVKLGGTTKGALWLGLGAAFGVAMVGIL